MTMSRPLAVLLAGVVAVTRADAHGAAKAIQPASPLFTSDQTAAPTNNTEWTNGDGAYLDQNHTTQQQERGLPAGADKKVYNTTTPEDCPPCSALASVKRTLKDCAEEDDGEETCDLHFIQRPLTGEGSFSREITPCMYSNDLKRCVANKNCVMSCHDIKARGTTDAYRTASRKGSRT